MLSTIRHISFDAWNTLFTPNKEFAAARTNLLARVFDVSPEEAKAGYTATKRFLDTAAELTGFGTNCSNVYKLLAAHFKNDTVDLVELQELVDDLFVCNRPHVDPETIQVLKRLRTYADCSLTLSVTSNTNFIGGDVLRACVFNEYFGSLFDALHFSDEAEAAKPSKQFFTDMMFEADFVNRARCATEASVEPNEILHVGDNLITDGHAVKFGMQFMHVHNPQHLVSQFKDLLHV